MQSQSACASLDTVKELRKHIKRQDREIAELHRMYRQLMERHVHLEKTVLLPKQDQDSEDCGNEGHKPPSLPFNWSTTKQYMPKFI